MAALQLEPSAHAPWTRTMFGRSAISILPSGGESSLRFMLSRSVRLRPTRPGAETHLHFHHCGGNHLAAGGPIYVQRRELDEPRTEGQLRLHALDPELVRDIPERWPR
jgi:hypothetical protein